MKCLERPHVIEIAFQVKLSKFKQKPIFGHLFPIRLTDVLQSQIPQNSRTGSNIWNRAIVRITKGWLSLSNYLV